MSMFSWRFVRVWQRNRDVFVKRWRSEAAGYLIEPIFILLTMGIGLGGFIGQVNGLRYIEFIVPGIIASYAMYSATFESTYSFYMRMEMQKTYDAILATPLTVEDIIAGEIFWDATRSMITGTSILLIAAAFQLVHSPWAVLIPVFTFLTGLLIASICIIFTSLAPSINSFNYFFTLFITPMVYFSGVFFPLSSFPQVIQDLSWIVPLTPVVNVARSLVTGVFSLENLLALLWILLLTAIFFAIALHSMRRRMLN